MPVIGYLGSGWPESDTVRLTSVRRGLNEAGYVENQGVAIEYRWADQLPALAADLVQYGVAVVVAAGVFSTLAAKSATQIIFASWCAARPQDGGLGLPLETVQVRLGHATLAMTADRYGHLFPSTDHAEVLAAGERALMGV